MAKYALKCDDDTWIRLYRTMRRDHISDAKIDKSEGNVDGNLICEEIIETSLRYKQYHEYLKNVTGRTVPFPIDEETKKERRTVAGIIKKGLARQGFSPATPEYRRFFSSAIYRSLFAPRAADIPWLKKYDPRWLENFVVFPLKAMGLNDLQLHLMKYGGLGLAGPLKHAEFEATAMEAVRDHKGECTERSKVMYPSFEEGGLDPFYASIEIQALHRDWPRVSGLGDVLPPVTPEDYFSGHIAIGIPNGSDQMYFEPNRFAEDIDYDKYARRISLREMYQIDIIGLATEMFSHGNNLPPEFAMEGLTVERLLAGAKALGESPSLAYIYSIEGQINLNKGDRTTAIRSLEDALKRDLKFHSARMAMCNALLNGGEMVAAEDCFLKLPEDMTHRPFGLGLIAFKKGENVKAREFWKKSLEMGADIYNTNVNIAKAYRAEGNFSESAEHVRFALAASPKSIEAAIELADLLSEQKLWQEAVNVLKRALAIDSTSRPALIRMTKLLMNLGRTDLARGYFGRYLISSAISMSSQKGFSDETFNEWVDLSQKLGTWMELQGASAILWQKDIHDIPVVIANIEAGCHAGDMDSARNTFAELVGQSDGLDLPATYFKHLRVIAECLGAWDKVTEICIKLRDNVPAYNLHMLHAAVRSKNETLTTQAVNAAGEWLDTIAGINPSDRSVDAIRDIQKDVCDLPADVISNTAMSPIFARLSEIIAETFKAAGIENSSRCIK